MIATFQRNLRCLAEHVCAFGRCWDMLEHVVCLSLARVENGQFLMQHLKMLPDSVLV